MSDATIRDAFDAFRDLARLANAVAPGSTGQNIDHLIALAKAHRSDSLDVDGTVEEESVDNCRAHPEEVGGRLRQQAEQAEVKLVQAEGEIRRYRAALSRVHQEAIDALSEA